MRSSSKDVLRSEAERDVIIASRKRCATQHHLSRDTRRPLLRLQECELQPRRQSFVDRLSGDLTELQWLSDVSRRAGQYAAIADDECVLVMHDVGQQAGTDFEQAGISAGSCWTEQIAGTNGLGTALCHRRLMTVMGDEHYFAMLSPFMCTASPVFDHADEVIGAISISAIDRGDIRDRGFAEHLLRMATGRIQARLFHDHYRDMVRTAIAPVDSGMDAYLNALIAVDADGIVRGATNAAASALGRERALALIGSPLDAIIDASVNRLVENQGQALTAQSAAGGPLMLEPSLPKPRRLATYFGAAAKPPPSAGGCSMPITIADFEGGDPKHIALVRRARQLFRAGLPLQLCGETGTGKLSLVRALHFDVTLGRRPLISISNSDIDEDVTSARVAHLLEQVRACAQAAPGLPPATLHLRDIAALPKAVQHQVARLLSDLETMSESAAEGFGINVIATGGHSDDPSIIAELRSHLAGDSMTLVPLCQRGDLRDLVGRMRDQMDEHRKPISPAAMAVLLAHRWPGNFRELRLVLRRALLLSEGSEVTLHDLPETLLPEAPAGRFPSGVPARDPEVSLLKDALASTNWNVSEAARRCGISRATLHRKIKALRIQRPRAARLTLIEAVETSR